MSHVAKRAGRYGQVRRQGGRVGDVRAGSPKERPAFTGQSLSPHGQWRMLRASVLVVEPQTREQMSAKRKAGFCRLRWRINNAVNVTRPRAKRKGAD
jgi:hypothetical protein